MLSRINAPRNSEDSEHIKSFTARMFVFHSYVGLTEDGAKMTGQAQHIPSGLRLQALEAVSYTTLWCYAVARIAHLRCDFRGFANILNLRDRGTRHL